jgi:hypothetical protein
VAPAPSVMRGRARMRVRDLKESQPRISVLERMASSVGSKRGNEANGMIGCLGRVVCSRRSLAKE